MTSLRQPFRVSAALTLGAFAGAAELAFLLTVFATIVLLVKMQLIGYAARLAAETTLSRADLRAAGIQLAIHACGGLLVLLVPAMLSVYKPPGMTRYG